MAHQWLRCNLSSAIFPFATDLWGRSIIVPQFDQNFDRTLASVADTDKDKGVPQAFYMHNCMPTPQGYQSVGYDKVINAMLGSPTDFDTIFPIISPNLARFLFSPAVGKNYIFDANVGAWASVSPISAGTLPSTAIVTTAFIHGQTYIYYQNYGCLVYDPVGKVMTPVALSGLSAANVKGICAANGYMIAWDDTTVAWSNTITETDFVPSLTTGAGGGSVADAKGKIICCLPISGGFLVYCEKNVVAARYSGNIRFPFIFKEVPGSGGIVTPESVSWQSNLSVHYAFTSVGLQVIDLAKTENLFPEASDFLSALIFEDFDEGTLAFSVNYLATELNVKVSAVSSRYIVLSYGVSLPDYTHALVFDLVLKRWGKLKITHRKCFQWNSPSLYGAITYGQLGSLTYGDLKDITYGQLATNINTPEEPRKTLAFLQADGTVKLVNFDLAQTNADGVLVIGKFQFRRNKFLVHQACDIESVRDVNTFNYYVVYSLDGKTLKTPVKGFKQTLPNRNGPNKQQWLKRISGLNISCMFIGAFNLTSFLLDFTEGGEVP